MEIKDWLLKAGIIPEDQDKVSFVSSLATIKPVEDEVEAEDIKNSILAVASDAYYQKMLFKSLEERGPLVVEGKPRMLHVSAFIVHEGVNLNNDAFTKEDLQAAVESGDLFKNGYGGMVDYNHYFDPIGYWYDSEFLYDEAAQKYGILAHGSIWAWRYPEYVDAILAETQNHGGRAPVSMAVLSNNVKPGISASGAQYRTFHDPIFVATTMLVGKDPGDLYGRGIVQDSPSFFNKEEAKGMLTLASQERGDEYLEDVLMDKTELKAVLAEVLSESGEDVTSRVAEIVQEKLDALSTTVAEKDKLLGEVRDSVTEIQGLLDAANATIQEKDVAISALTTEKDTLQATIDELTSEIETYKEVEQKAAFAEKRSARFNELESFVQATLEASPDKEAILDRWAALPDEDWEARKQELRLATKADNKGGGPLPVVRKGATTKTIEDYLR